MTVRRYEDLQQSLKLGSRSGARVDKRTGFLHAKVRPTRTGIMVYRLADGSISRELKHPDDVFDPASLATLERIIVTRGHPRDDKGKPIDVTTATVDALKKGHGGDKIERERIGDHDHPVVNITVNDADTVRAIVDGGLDQVSMGYSVEVVDEAGVWNGQHYDRRHTNIRYDHLAAALPMGGRGGTTVNVVLDEADAELVVDEQPDPTTSTKDAPSMTTIRITLDEVGLDIEQATYATLQPILARREQQVTTAKADAKAATDKLAVVEGERDAAKAAIAAEKKRADEAEAKAGKPVELKPLLTVLASARKLVALDDASVEKLLAQPDPITATRKATVLLVCKDEAEAIKGKPDLYFEARFDALVAGTTKTDDTQPIAALLLGAGPAPKGGKGTERTELDEVLDLGGDPLAYLDANGITGQPERTRASNS